MSDDSQRQQGTVIRKRGPEPVSRNALPLLRTHLAKRGFSQIEIVTRWSEIAGSALAGHCVPHKFSTAAAGATLTLLADDRAALELQHQTPKLIDRINRYFGAPIVSKIKVVAGELPKPPVRRLPRPLTAAEEAQLSVMISQVEDPDLRDALMRLGRNAMGESRKSAILKR